MKYRVALVVFCVLSATPIWATSSDVDQEINSSLSMNVVRYELDNGLRVVLVPDRAIPTVAVSIYYDVGSRVEEKGHTGFAHLFEHMMFEGSANVAKMEHFEHIVSRGGELNGTTSEDRTNYYETLPSQELELALWLEADRMRALDISAEKFANQQAAVQSEKKQNYDNRAYRPSFLKIQELAYGDYFPYAHSTIGDTEDLQKAKLEEVQAFFDAYYAPNNAVLSVAGDFEVNIAKSFIEKHFAKIPSRRTRPYKPPPFRKQTAAKRETIADKNANLDGLHMAYHIPPNGHADHYVLELIATILGDGASSRLEHTLVREQALCNQIYVGTDDHRGPDLFSFFALIADGKKATEVESAIESALSDLAKNGPSARELERATNRIEARFVFGLQSNLARSKAFAEFELYFGDARKLLSEIEKYRAVTSSDIKRVAADYFKKVNQTILFVDATANDRGQKGAR